MIAATRRNATAASPIRRILTKRMAQLSSSAKGSGIFSGKPKKRQVVNMCGGSAAVACRTPPRRCRGRRVARQEQDARSVRVEAMDEARPLGGIEAQGIERAVEMMRRSGAALDREAGRLVEHDDVGVAIEPGGADRGDVAVARLD